MVLPPKHLSALSDVLVYELESVKRVVETGLDVQPERDEEMVGGDSSCVKELVGIGSREYDLEGKGAEGGREEEQVRPGGPEGGHEVDQDEFGGLKVGGRDEVRYGGTSRSA